MCLYTLLTTYSHRSLPPPPPLLSPWQCVGDTEVSNYDYDDGGVNGRRHSSSRPCEASPGLFNDALLLLWRGLRSFCRPAARFAIFVVYFRHVVVIVANPRHRRSRRHIDRWERGGRKEQGGGGQDGRRAGRPAPLLSLSRDGGGGGGRHRLSSRPCEASPGPFNDALFLLWQGLRSRRNH
jgi:hypothetical protein